jgi:hypothetical protein
MMRCAPIFGLGLLFALAAFGVSTAGDKAGDKSKVDPAALERTRASIKMLDDLYKNAVVIITKAYVEQQADTPAAAVAKELFEAMHKKGWHSARLVDATGKPKRQANAPKTDFEKRGVEQMNAGKAYFEEIGDKDGKPVLRVATVVPALMPQCITCHGGKQGRVLGAIVYELPIK